jgi:uncharacterized glyoxalase superfamily protein PhnB
VNVIDKLTTVVVVEAIEPALAFWGALGFEKRTEVPHEGKLGFVILAKGDEELMLQTKDSVREDLGREPPALMLYAHVSSLDEARKALGAVEVLIDRRKTFYGATESWVRDPAGTILGLSEMG